MHLGAIELRIHQIAKTYCTPQWRWRHAPKRDAFKGMVFWLVTAGRGEVSVRGVDYKLGTGDCFLFRMSSIVDAKQDPTRPLVVAWINFDFIMPDGNPVEPGVSMLPVYRRFSDIRFISSLFDRCRSACAEEGKDSENALHWLRSLIMEVGREDRRSAKLGGVESWSKEIDLLSSEVRSNPGNCPTVEEMAHRAGLSEDHFIRVFRKERGVTPGEFVLRARIEAAISLLLFTSLPISEIADELGYCDVFYFSKQFKRRIGCSPSHYRRMKPSGQPD